MHRVSTVDGRGGFGNFQRNRITEGERGGESVGSRD